MLSKLEAVMLREPQEVQVWCAVSSFFFQIEKIQVCNASVYLQKMLYFISLLSTSTFIVNSLESDE